MKNSKTLVSVVAMIAAAFLVAGCGKKDKDKDKGKGGGTTTTGGGGGTTTTPPPKGGYEGLDTVPNAGTISGTIWYKGDKKPGEYKVSKDHGVCVHNGKPDESIVVADGKLANAVVYISDEIKSGKKWPSETVEVDNKECRFVPHVAVGKHQGELAAKNSDKLLHNTNILLKNGGTTVANLNLTQEGAVEKAKLKKEGLNEVKCDVHEWMQAYVWVSKHPYAVVSGPDGSFTLDGVPPGTYKVKVWHEVLGEKEAEAKVDANGTAKLEVDFTS